MKKKFVKSIIAITLCLTFTSFGAYADSRNSEIIQSIISGNQDLLVLATINEKGTSAYEVEIIHEIGAVPPEGQPTADAQTSEAAADDVQNDIFVEGLTSYMYYDNYDYLPKKGDNVLLSLTFNGNMYSVKNGAFKVDYADIDNFNFMIPDGVGSDVIAELSALYVYVESDGKRGDVFVEDNKVYGYNADGKQEEIIGQFGLKFIDEFGDTTDNTAGDFPQTAVPNAYASDNWVKAVLIIVAGVILGGIVVHLVSKFEKRRS